MTPLIASCLSHDRLTNIRKWRHCGRHYRRPPTLHYGFGILLVWHHLQTDGEPLTPPGSNRKRFMRSKREKSFLHIAFSCDRIIQRVPLQCVLMLLLMKAHHAGCNVFCPALLPHDMSNFRPKGISHTSFRCMGDLLIVM